MLYSMVRELQLITSTYRFKHGHQRDFQCCQHSNQLPWSDHYTLYTWDVTQSDTGIAVGRLRGTARAAVSRNLLHMIREKVYGGEAAKCRGWGGRVFSTRGGTSSFTLSAAASQLRAAAGGRYVFQCAINRGEWATCYHEISSISLESCDPAVAESGCFFLK